MEMLDIPEKDKIEFILSLDKLEKIGANPAQLDRSRQQQKLFLAFGGSVTGNGTGFWIAIE